MGLGSAGMSDELGEPRRLDHAQGPLERGGMSDDSRDPVAYAAWRRYVSLDPSRISAPVWDDQDEETRARWCSVADAVRARLFHDLAERMRAAGEDAGERIVLRALQDHWMGRSHD
jgi:hypothetical protein